MKAVAVGVLSAIVALGLFFAGFLVGANVAMDSNSGYTRYLQATAANQESAQMQCIHWVDKWRSAPKFQGDEGMPAFGMYTALCGKPDSNSHASP